MLSGPPGPKVAGESCPGSDKLPRHLPDKVSSTSSSSGAGPRGKGWRSHPQLPLFSGISAPTFLSRAGPGADTPAPPHRAPLQPPPPARSVPVAGSRRPCSGPRKGLGARGGWGEMLSPSPWEPPRPRSPSSKLRLVGRTPARR